MAKKGLYDIPGVQSSSSSSSSLTSSILYYSLIGAIVVPFAAAIQIIMGPSNKHVSSAQRNQDAALFAAIGIAAALGLVVYLHLNAGDPKDSKSDPKPKDTTNAARPKDIWKVGQNSQTGLKKPKAAYNEKPFGSKYYYAHNDSNTTGGYKDGLKMEDYRMNGPRLLSKNGLSVVDDNDDHGEIDKGSEEATTTENDTTSTRITAQDPHVKNITKYLWDDPGNAKGIATIRVDVLPGDKFGEFLDVSDVTIQDVQASLPGEGLLVKVATKSSDDEDRHYQLKINKLFGDAADVKVVIKPKRLLIKIHKKKHGFLSRNDNNMAAWPQPHRKI